MEIDGTGLHSVASRSVTVAPAGQAVLACPSGFSWSCGQFASVETLLQNPASASLEDKIVIYNTGSGVKCLEVYSIRYRFGTVQIGQSRRRLVRRYLR